MACDDVDWLAAAASVTAAVDAVVRLPSGDASIGNFNRDMDTYDWISSGYYD